MLKLFPYKSMVIASSLYTISVYEAFIGTLYIWITEKPGKGYRILGVFVFEKINLRLGNTFKSSKIIVNLYSCQLKEKTSYFLFS